MKFPMLLGSVAIMGLVAAGFSSCKDDEDDPVTVTLTFVSASSNIQEGDEGIKASVTLDQPAPSDLVINYEISGTATRKSGTSIGDYEIVGTAGQIEIAAGETSGHIELNVFTDGVFEDNESIILTLDGVDNTQVQIGALDEMELTIAGGGNLIVSFAETSLSIEEGQQNVKANLILDQAASEDIVITYEISGTAIRKDGTTAGDYEIVGTAGQVAIAAGETEAAIDVNVLTDDVFELDETIIFTLIDADYESVTFGTVDQIELTIAGGGSLTASFSNTTLAVKESDQGLHEIEVQINEAPAIPITLHYTITSAVNGQGQLVEGIALDTVTADANDIPFKYWDYFISGTSGEVTIPAGQTKANILLNVYSDFVVEESETITLTLTEESGIAIDNQKKAVTITVAQEDGTVVLLNWSDESVDMDLFLWAKNGNDATLLSYENWKDSDPEFAIIPNTITSADMLMSYTYFSGPADPNYVLDFEVLFIKLIDGLPEPQTEWEVFNAQYTAANIHNYIETEMNPLIAQTFEIVNGVFGNFSEIQVADELSRVRFTPLNPLIKPNLMKYRKKILTF